MRKFLQEFKAFAVKGNVIDLAVGVIIGSSFTAIVNSLVQDVLTPLLSLLTKGLDFTTLSLPLGVGEDAAKLAYGNFLSAVLNFLLVGLSVFLFVKLLNTARARLKRSEPAAAPRPKRLCPYCCMEIAEKATRCPHCTSRLEEGL